MPRTKHLKKKKKNISKNDALWASEILSSCPVKLTGSTINLRRETIKKKKDK